MFLMKSTTKGGGTERKTGKNKLILFESRLLREGDKLGYLQENQPTSWSSLYHN